MSELADTLQQFQLLLMANKLMDKTVDDGLTQDEIKELQFSLSNIPTYNEVLTNGVGNYLLEVKK